MRANGDQRWLHLLPGIIRQYNNGFVSGTTVRRMDVNAQNYLKLLEQLQSSDDPTLLFNIGTTTHYPKPLEKLIWRYKIGQKVLLARRVDYTLKNKSNFEKPSLVGSYGPEVYTVTERAGKNNWKLFICPVYRLSGLTSWFYESEIKPALFAEPKLRRKRRSRRLKGKKATSAGR
jgi:hypothetical protein